MTETAQQPVKPRGIRRPSPFPSPREQRLVDCIVSGMSPANAYRTAYDRPDLAEPYANQRGCRVKARPRVKALFEQLSKEHEAKAQTLAEAQAKAQVAEKERGRRKIKEMLLTLNDRLSILAQIATDPKSKPADKARAIDVYTKIAGGFAPTQMQLTGAEGGPIQSESTVTATVQVLSVRDRIAIFRAKREAVQGQSN